MNGLVPGWCDICMEQRLMKAAKSEVGLSRGRMRNSDSGYKCMMDTSPQSLFLYQQLHGRGYQETWFTPQRPCQNMMKGDTKVIRLVLKWLELL